MPDEVTSDVSDPKNTFKKFHEKIWDQALKDGDNLVERLYDATNDTETVMTELNEKCKAGEVNNAEAPRLISLAKASLGTRAGLRHEYLEHLIKIRNFLDGQEDHFETEIHEYERELTRPDSERIQDDVESDANHRNTIFQQEDAFPINSDHVIREQESQELDTVLERLQARLYNEDLESEFEDLNKRLHQSDKQNRKLSKRNHKLKKEIDEWKEEVNDRDRTIRILQERQRSHGITNQPQSKSNPMNSVSDSYARKRQRTHGETEETSQGDTFYNGTRSGSGDLPPQFDLGSHNSPNQPQARPDTSHTNPSSTQQQPSNQDPNPTRQRNSIITNKVAKRPKSDRAPKEVTDEKIHELTAVIALLNLGGQELPTQVLATLECFRTDKGMESLKMGVKGGSRCAVARFYKSEALLGSNENDTCGYCLKHDRLCIKVTPDGRRTPLPLPAESRQGLTPADVGYWVRQISGS